MEEVVGLRLAALFFSTVYGQQINIWPRLPQYEFAALPSFGVAGRTVYVTDCPSTSSCSTGGGSTVWIFRDTGSAWTPFVPIGGGGGGGAPSGPAGGALAGTYPNPTLSGGITSGMVVYGDASAGTVTGSSKLTTAVDGTSTRAVLLSPDGASTGTLSQSDSALTIDAGGGTASRIIFAYAFGDYAVSLDGTGGLTYVNPSGTTYQLLDGGTTLNSTGVRGWTVGSATAAKDTGIARNTAGVLEVNNGTLGTLRDAIMRALTLTSTLTFPDDVRQTFNPGATNAGLNVGSIASAPSTPSDGDLWYDSTANELTARINGANVSIGGGGGGLTFPQVLKIAMLRL